MPVEVRGCLEKCCDSPGLEPFWLESMIFLKWSFFEWLGAGPCRGFIDHSIPDKYMNPSFHEESPLTPRSAPRRWRWALLTRRCHELIVGRLREKQELDPEQVYKP